MASKPDTSFKVRMSDRLKAAVQEAATANGRSINSEIISRLANSFTAEHGLDGATTNLYTQARAVRRLAMKTIDNEQRLLKRLREVAPDDPLLARIPELQLVDPKSIYGEET